SWLDGSPEERRARLIGSLRERLAGVLGLDRSRVDLDRPLHTMGLDSLMALALKAAAEADLGIILPLALLFEGPSIAQLAERLLEQATEIGAPAAVTSTGTREATAESPLSSNQQALWYLHQLAP